MDPCRFYARIHTLAEQLVPGSTVDFLNAFPEEEFAQIMSTAGFKVHASDDTSWACLDGAIQLRHFQGETTSERSVQAVLEARPIDTALVLGSHATIDMPPKSSDTRVLSTILILRNVAETLGGRSIHIVGENGLDITSKLALAPRKQSGDMLQASDFINVVAIKARVLAQTLAFPLISQSVFELFSPALNTVTVEIREAENFLPMGLELSFGVVQQLLQAKAKQAQAMEVILGYIDYHGNQVFCPGHRSTHSYRSGEQLICLRRDNVVDP